MQKAEQRCAQTCLPPSLPSVECMMAVNRSVVGSGPIRCPGKSCLQIQNTESRIRKVVLIREECEVSWSSGYAIRRWVCY